MDINSQLSKLLLKYIFLKDIISNPNSSQMIKVINEKPYLSITTNGKESTLIDISPYIWDSFENMYYILIYSEMLSQGYLLCPIDNGVLCINSHGEEYQISLNPYHCTCGNFQWKGSCKHVLMLKGFLLNKKRISSFLHTRFNNT